MADLELTLSWLDMSQYLERFVQAGFDSWETVLEITEDDLESLNVGLGHRRKLQKEIANTRRLARDPAFVTPLYSLQAGRTPDAKDDTQNLPSKRGYRHHPRSDPNAPERPYSAYVMFSNHVREEVKDESLSFTEISRQVGERWQALPPAQRDIWKQRAAVPWEKYKVDVAEYQKTETFQEYQRYLNEFKSAQATKKPRRKSSNQDRQPSQSYSSVSQQSTVSPKVLPSGYNIAPSITPSASKRKGSQRMPTLTGCQDVPGEETGMAISRLEEEDARGPTGEESVTSRVRQACEPCRQKKTKCHGEKPACKHCRELDIECYYADGKRGQDKKLVDELRRKLIIYEKLLFRFVPQVSDDDQQAIQDAVSLPPQLESTKYLRQRAETVDDAISSHGSLHGGGGESEASAVGSMGSTDHVNEDDFMDAGTEGQPRAFSGQASDIKWIQRLKTELRQKPHNSPGTNPEEHVRRASTERKPGPSIGSYYPQPSPEDMDTSIVGDQVDPYDLPIESTANALIHTYLTTVHTSLPLLDKTTFVHHYDRLYTSMDPEVAEDRTFLAIVYLVFAIAAVHAHLTQARWVGDARDHSLYFAKARMLAVDCGIFNDMAHIGQVQVFGLGGMYLLLTDQVNRAWNITGLAVRSGQSLGMHLSDVTPGKSLALKDHHALVWFAVMSLEKVITVMTGRPSMVNKQDCSVSMPHTVKDETSPSASNTSDGSRKTSATVQGSRTSTSNTSESTLASFQTQSFENARTPNASTYFAHYVELTSLAEEVVAQLYRPWTRHLKWSDIQNMIAELNRKAERWCANLPFGLKPSSPVQDPEIESYRVALGIFYHGTKIIINRPCLCRLDRRIADQSISSRQANYGAAYKCVDSARALLNIIFTTPDSMLLHQGTIWWVLLHHVKRALTILLLELSFRAEHMPSEAGEILSEAKKAINWLRFMGAHSITAHRSWIAMSRLLQAAAQKVGGNTADIVTAPPIPQQQEHQQQHQSQQQRQHRPSHSAQPRYLQSVHIPYDPNDPTTWPPLTPQGAMREHEDYDSFFSDFATRGDWDQFGFSPGHGRVQNLFPTASEMGRMGAGTEFEEDYPMGGAGADGGESGFDGRTGPL